jgi:hypothetical protein
VSHDGAAAAQSDVRIACCVTHDAAGLVARLERDLVHQFRARQVDDEYAVAIRVGDDRRQAVGENVERAAGDRRRWHVGDDDGLEIIGGRVDDDRAAIFTRPRRVIAGNEQRCEGQREERQQRAAMRHGEHSPLSTSGRTTSGGT